MILYLPVPCVFLIIYNYSHFVFLWLLASSVGCAYRPCDDGLPSTAVPQQHARVYGDGIWRKFRAPPCYLPALCPTRSVFVPFGFAIVLPGTPGRGSSGTDVLAVTSIALLFFFFLWWLRLFLSWSFTLVVVGIVMLTL